MTDAPLHPLHGQQAPASDPRAHVWLSASAGTGKTQVLAARVLRLLLHGARPEAILCLTFTKAGAAEMAERINSRLARWVRSDRDALFADLRALGERGTLDQVAYARTLFARVLDAPGGLRIQTIHGFCQSLLAAFPVEAGLTPGFRALEAREESVLQRAALARMLEDEAAAGRVRLIEAIGALSLRLGEGGAEEFLTVCARQPEAMAGLPSGVQPFIRRALGLPQGDIEAAVEAACADDAFDVETLRHIAAANAGWGTKTGLERADLIAGWLGASPANRATTLDRLHGVWATAKGEMRAKHGPKDADYGEWAARLHARCGDLLAIRVRAAYADCLAGALEAGRAYAAAYADAKRRAGVVDFDDLIAATVRVLGLPGMGEWIRYKLDRATDHVLIDEAQDTNPRQWAIVSAFADEFFAGEGTRPSAARTLFSVGDYKQAIYGFQGTDPIFFRAAGTRFDRLASVVPEFGGPPRPLHQLSLTHSFRSTAAILAFVDAAIAAMPAPGMGDQCILEPHASQVAGPGRVTLLPPVSAGADPEDEEGWIDDAVRRQAGDIARMVRGWLDDRRMLEAKGRPLRPEDILILVRRRGDLAALIVARLYAEGVPVAGVDRLRLNAPLAVQDLLAAVRFALQPADDLNLASLLVSPLIGWSQERLMEIAAPPRPGSLWRAVREQGDADTVAKLQVFLRRADIATPYRFLEDILSGDLEGRRRLIERLGDEARDPIEELLNAALNFESVATPSLQRFLDWFDRGDVEIVRDSSRPQAAVRVMTAHGAKGLQAPVVILADATADPRHTRRDILDWQPAGHDGPAFPIFRPRSVERDAALATTIDAADAREMEEHWRLFYVAATRAEEELVIGGALPATARGEPPAASWYAAATRAMDALGVPPGEMRSYHAGAAIERTATPSQSTRVAGMPALPDWARRPAPAEARPSRPLAPSAIGEDAVADPPPDAAMRAAAERGQLLHALFERLPALDAAERRPVGAAWLAARGADNALLNTALRVIKHPDFADIFGADALVEAPIAAVVDGQVVSGTVDRLLIAPDRIALIDFKTGRRVPADLAAIPAYHLRQMAAYAAALAVIFPDRPIEAALLYTSGPVLYALPTGLLAAHAPAS
ncbi:double-strand break repair helicase AddA [Sphingomonas baiyangensis]|uniref:DNA 3'-5' helicase n=1 Tax=Sphingomonas baiyangensis TaxID=2572576 RepID=A0A4U1L142_9SPHN|nr:double-strand break repair helicase AddA [Sphingomonas baiyangensis]TKD50499.1 double-strand break repair helicase AddA [Sphingomonas baiyangensis]